MRAEATVFLQREVAQPLALGLGMGHQLPHRLVGAAEGHPLAHQVIGQVGGQQEGVGGGRLQPLATEAQVGQHGREDLQGAQQGIGRLEQGHLVLLQVAVVGQGEALQQGEHGRQVPGDAGRLGPGQFGQVGVALLGHDGRSRRETGRQLDEAELGAGPEHYLLGQAREVHQTGGGSSNELDHEVAAGDGVHRVGRDAAEAQLPRQEVAVYGVGDAGQGAGAQGKLVGPLAAVQQPPPVALQHPEVGQQVVGEEDGLGVLQVGVAGHDDAQVGLGQGDDGPLQAADGGGRLPAGVHDEQAQVGGDEVVAGAGGMQPARRLAQLLVQARLDVQMNVLQLVAEGKGARLDLGTYLLEGTGDGLGLLGRHDALSRQHAYVGQRAGDVVAVEAAVVGEGKGIGQGPGVETLGGGALGRLLAAHPGPNIVGQRPFRPTPADRSPFPEGEMNVGRGPDRVPASCQVGQVLGPDGRVQSHCQREVGHVISGDRPGAGFGHVSGVDRSRTYPGQRRRHLLDHAPEAHVQQLAEGTLGGAGQHARGYGAPPYVHYLGGRRRSHTPAQRDGVTQEPSEQLYQDVAIQDRVAHPTLRRRSGRGPPSPGREGPSPRRCPARGARRATPAALLRPRPGPPPRPPQRPGLRAPRRPPADRRGWGDKGRVPAPSERRAPALRWAPRATGPLSASTPPLERHQFSTTPAAPMLLSEGGQVQELADGLDGVIGRRPAFAVGRIGRLLHRLVPGRPPPDGQHAQGLGPGHVGAEAVAHHGRLLRPQAHGLQGDLEDARVRLQVAHLAGDGHRLEEGRQPQVVQLLPEAGPRPAAVGHRPQAEAPLPQRLQGGDDVGEELAPQELAAQVPGVPERLGLLPRQVQAVARGHLPTQLRVVGAFQVAPEGALGGLLDGQADVAAQVDAVAVHVVAPGRQQAADALHRLAAHHLLGRHVGEVPEGVAQVEEDGLDAHSASLRRPSSSTIAPAGISGKRRLRGR